MIVQLPPAERRKALDIARARQAENLAKARRDRYGAPSDTVIGLRYHQAGTMGEAALAYLYGLPYDGNLGNLDAADAGPLQARTTMRLDGRLILHPPPYLKPDGKLSRGDKPTDVFVHIKALGQGRLDLIGWVYGHEGQQPEYWLDPGTGRPAYFVANRILQPLPLALIWPETQYPAGKLSRPHRKGGRDAVAPHSGAGDRRRR